MKTISLLILVLFAAQTSFAQSGSFDFSIGISPTLGCKADYRYDPSSGGGFNFARNNYSECLSSGTSPSSTSLNLGEAIAYQYFSDQKIQDAVISITNTTQDIILRNIGAVKSRDDQISQTNQNMDSILNKLRTSFDREIRHAQEHSEKWEQVNQQFDRDVIQHLENYRQNITHQIKEVKAKRSRLHDLADNDFSTSDSHSTNFSQYLSSSKLQSKLKKELGNRSSHSGLSLARSIYNENPDFQQPRFVKLEQEFEKTKQAGLIDQESKTLFDAAKKFYDSETQRQYADEIVDHLSARRIQKTTDGIQDLDQYFSHDLASKVIDFEQKMTKAQAQVKLTRQLIKNGHDFGHPLDVINRLVNHSEMATSAASEIFYDKFMEQGELLIEMAIGSLDIASNFTPIVSPARDFYELTTGRSLFTNDELSKNERIIVGASFLTLGIGSSVRGFVKVTYEFSKKLGARLGPGIIKTIERIAVSARKTIPIKTPFGKATQEMTRDAIAARAKVQNGGYMYRLGKKGRSQTGKDAQFWSLEHPKTPGYAQKYGIPEENIANADFIERATIKENSNFITRKAPAVGNNKGGGIEIVTTRDGVSIESHTTLD